jgi:hypothetical protein
MLLDLDGPVDELTPVDGLPSPRRIADAIRLGRSPADRVFDRFLPGQLRVVSGQHWTPLMVAMRAAEWLDEVGVESVVDVGSGVGKFCVVAALSGRARFTGVEQRGRLVAAGRNLASLFGVQDRVSFVHGTFGKDPVPEAQAYYLFNPFGENLLGLSGHLDDEVELSGVRYVRDITAIEQLLRDAPLGTYLLTYNGFGGKVPAGYQTLRVDRELPNVLRMWRKMRHRNADRVTNGRDAGTCAAA